MALEDINTVHPSVQKLIEEVQKPTDERKIQQTPLFEFDEKGESKEQQENDNTTTVKDLSEESVEWGADFAIGMYDIGQQKLLAHFGKRKRNKKLRKKYGANALEKLETLKNEIEALTKNKMQQTVLREFTTDDYGMLRVEKAFEEYLEELALTDDEKDLIRKPLMKLMIKHGGEIPPGLALGLAVLQITGSRVADLAML